MANKMIQMMQQKREALKTVDKAISLRNLDRNTEAIELLNQVIVDFPFYKPALSILGNTYLKIGEIDKAESIFRKMIDDCMNSDYKMLIIEAYCNLGNLYFQHRKDMLKAIQFYENSLTVIDPDSIDDANKYNILVSGAYMGLCNIYAMANEHDKAKYTALQCIKLNPNVVLVNRIYGVIVANTLLSMPPIEIFRKSDLITELMQARTALDGVLCDDDSDIGALYAMCVIINTICVLRTLGCIASDPDIEGIAAENDKYYKIFEDLSRQSHEANKNLDAYKDYISSLAIAGLQSKGYKLKEVEESVAKKLFNDI
jgi:tetratricopeptide (TPR) repeat protein